MKFFKRRGRAEQADEHLTYFTVAEADDFRALVRVSFAEAGREVVIHPEQARDFDDTVFGLWNIGALCAGKERADWPEIIDDHVRRVTNPDVGALEELTQEELDTGLHVRIVEKAAVPDLDSVGYARELVDGLLEVLCIDLPDSVVIPSAEDIAARGSAAELQERGRENLRTLLLTADVVADTQEPDGGGRFTVVTGESFFTASLALLLPETVYRYTRETDRGRGVLLAVPYRHQLLYRVVDGPDAAAALHYMFTIAMRGFYEQPGPLSPHLYWAREGRPWEQVTSFADDRPQVVVGDELAKALG